MGIKRIAADNFEEDLAAFKASGPTRAQKRKYVAALVDRASEWLSKFDAQEAAAPANFAASKQAQFNAHLDALGEPELAVIDAAD